MTDFTLLGISLPLIIVSYVSKNNGTCKHYLPHQLLQFTQALSLGPHELKVKLGAVILLI